MSTPSTLEKQLNGTLLHPGDERYEEARTVWNAMIDRKPAHIVQCRDASDVIHAVNHAREHRLPLSVKGGGHSVAGHSVCNDGLMIDLSPMSQITIDPQARTARVGGGATWADFDAEAQEHGLATTGGMVSTTGVAGLTLGGGIGHLARSFGLSCDNMIGADVVTAGGELVRASENENRDLFWGLRGGGGNFGIVTTFEFRLHEVGPQIMAGPVFHAPEDAPDVLRQYREFTRQTPDHVACYAVFAAFPPIEPIPESYHGTTALILLPSCSSGLEEGEKQLEDVRAIGNPVFDGVAPIPYAGLQQSLDAGAPKGQRYYWKSHYMASIPDEAIDTVVEYANPLPSPYTFLGFEQMGGAIGRVGVTGTPYPHREAAYSFGIFGGWSDPNADREVIDWVRRFYDALTPYTTGGMYANYQDQDDGERSKKAFLDNYQQLVEVKRKWDPENLLRMNQNIKP